MPWKEQRLETMREEFVKRVLAHYTVSPPENKQQNRTKPQKTDSLLRIGLLCFFTFRYPNARP